ncbi:hypothetical protein [Bosea sp. BH3]|uniref:hypothetical protein n=1 Tax=Bosea sp. BH3 TaxID=2871701 RepID=UPI0021CB1788|nr:hypothetical protein [Bosea sp. BH3]MCU4182203.1 hypothetical protein [Bosea sp. BH3]
MLNALVTLPRSPALLQILSLGNPFARCRSQTRYAIAPSAFGLVLFAISHGRIVSIELGRDAQELIDGFRRSFPHAREAKGDGAFWESGIEVLRAIETVELGGGLDPADTGSGFAMGVRSLLHAREGQPLRYVGATVH